MTRRVMTHIRLGIRSGSPPDQSPRCPHDETLGPYLPITKLSGVSLRNVAECLREISWSFSAKFRRENHRRNNSFLFFSAKKKQKQKYFAQGVFRGETWKRAFFGGWGVVAGGGVNNSCSVRTENSVTRGNCSASVGKPRDADQ